METKTCSKCRVEKSVTAFYRRRARNGGYGLQAHCKDCQNASAREWQRTNPARVKVHDRRRALRARYGDDAVIRYDVLYDRQLGRCAICGKEERLVDAAGRRTRLAMDHCHDTGRVRGLLCRSCNGLLGQIGDRPEAIRRFLDYVLAPPGYQLPERLEVPVKWANVWGHCQDCLTTAVPHSGNGLCRNCYMRAARSAGVPWAEDSRSGEDRKARGAHSPSRRPTRTSKPGPDGTTSTYPQGAP